MTRHQRQLHFWTWLFLGPLLAAGLALAIVSRRPVPIQDPPPAVRTSASTSHSAVDEGGKP
jgi:hypothetical protein